MNLLVYGAAGVFALSCLVLFRRPGRPVLGTLTVSTCAAILLGALVLVCAAPPTLAAVNDLTGVVNFGAPLTYGMLSAYSCALLVLLVNWRGGPRSRIRRRVLASMAAYAVLIAALVVLFTLAEAPDERLTDLDTYYANTPFMREMILLYLAGHSAATLVMCAVCVKWGREVTGLLRTGLRLILAGSLLDLVGFQLAKYTAVVARWYGHDVDFLSTTLAPPMASLGALVCSAGFVLPRLLPAAVAQWRGLGDYRRLGPLWALLRFAPTAPKPAASWWQSPRERLQWREVSIHDALLALAPYFDDRVREREHEAALRAGRTARQARLAAEAAMLTDAARRAAAHEEPPADPSTYRLHATQVSGPGALVELARTLGRAPAGAPAREGTVRAAHGWTHG
ncbi:MAB_1171c family putative transporter [Streptomyces sp. SCSIO 75703]|uniref:MAB_1171c family putative transporter n=1 Tax=unclassified Streptomyces TaxID=2593676 RepID=UPI0004BEEF51|nr:MULTISPECIES: MAB_1171c family putative transporter [unclassified Streptomyces]